MDGRKRGKETQEITVACRIKAKSLKAESKVPHPLAPFCLTFNPAIQPYQMYFRRYSHGCHIVSYPRVFIQAGLFIWNVLSLCSLGKLLKFFQASAQMSPGLHVTTLPPSPGESVAVSAKSSCDPVLIFHLLYCPQYRTIVSFLLCHPNLTVMAGVMSYIPVQTPVWGDTQNRCLIQVCWKEPMERLWNFINTL